MKKLFSIFLIVIFYNCNSQKAIKIIKEPEIEIINTFNSKKDCDNPITIYTDQENFDQFQRSIPKSFQKSGPLFQINFNAYNIAVLCKKNIHSYNLDSITVYNSKNVLSISPIVNYNNDSEENSWIIQIPKEINSLKMK
jgi:hypothetical protein